MFFSWGSWLATGLRALLLLIKEVENGYSGTDGSIAPSDSDARRNARVMDR